MIRTGAGDGVFETFAVVHGVVVLAHLIQLVVGRPLIRPHSASGCHHALDDGQQGVCVPLVHKLYEANFVYWIIDAKHPPREDGHLQQLIVFSFVSPKSTMLSCSSQLWLLESESISWMESELPSELLSISISLCSPEDGHVLAIASKLLMQHTKD